MTCNQRPTILVVTYERIEATKRCIDAVFKHTPQPLNLIIVDNKSRGEVRNYLVEAPGMKLFLDENRGLYRALNLGVQLVQEEFIAFLDCDIVVTEGWWEALVTQVQSAPDTGLAGSRYVNPDGSLQEGYPVLSKEGWYGSNKLDLKIPADCQYIAIGCSVFRKSAWNAVGRFDESYFISHGDIDFCYKLRYEGNYRIRYCPSSSVVHDHSYFKEPEYESLRFKTDICDADYRRFQEKWEKIYSIENRSPEWVKEGVCEGQAVD